MTLTTLNSIAYERLTELIQGGVHPWAVLDGVDYNDVLTKIVTVASKHGVPLERSLDFLRSSQPRFVLSTT
jgi:hypothetical protein